MLPEYIAYIQITLREAKLLNSSLADCPLTKVYDKATADAVLKFQQVYKARVKDGIVDSETKSLFAREVWKKMLQTDNTRYQAVVDRIKKRRQQKLCKVYRKRRYHCRNMGTKKYRSSFSKDRLYRKLFG